MEEEFYMLGTRTIATVATIAAILAAPGGGCTKGVKAPAAQACNPAAAAAATPVPAHLVAFTDPAPTETLYVNACAADVANNQFTLVRVPIRVDYDISTEDPHNNPQLQVGLLRLNKQPVQATTTYTHPIPFPSTLPFTLDVTVTYTGRNIKDVGKVIECWTELGRGTAHYERTEVIRATITHNNYMLTGGAGSARVRCTFIN
jgi:hypothetical protein